MWLRHCNLYFLLQWDIRVQGHPASWANRCCPGTVQVCDIRQRHKTKLGKSLPPHRRERESRVVLLFLFYSLYSLLLITTLPFSFPNCSWSAFFIFASFSVGMYQYVILSLQDINKNRWHVNIVCSDSLLSPHLWFTSYCIRRSELHTCFRCYFYTLINWFYIEGTRFWTFG